MDEDNEMAGDMVVPAPYMEMTDECHHYTELKEVPRELQKYWHQRYSIFPNYDDEVYLTDDAWFGVTPQPVADKIAQDIRLPTGVAPADAVLVDMFAGVGGNTIAFARSRRWGRVIGIERDTATLACAQNNAALLWGDDELADDAITWVHGDCFDFVDRLRHRPATLDPALRVDPAVVVLFASPPWGGVSYRDQPIFDLATMRPYNLQALHDVCGPMAHALYLPRTSDLRQIAALAPPGDRSRLEVVQYCMYQASKAMVVYFPAAGGEASSSEDSSSEESSEESSGDSSEESSDSSSEEEENEDDDMDDEEEEEDEDEDEDDDDDEDEDEDDQVDNQDNMEEDEKPEEITTRSSKSPGI